ncbi:MAG: pitrilysin family protein [Pseudomonadota bacterium]
MHKRFLHWSSQLLLCFSLLLSNTSFANTEFDIPFTRYTLDNGLTLIVHEDNKAPIVAVNLWYHVGSKNENIGKTGFAHLFEHLMFNGSENYNDEYFKPFDRVGATGMNGTTSFDRTNYFQVVPKNALDMALWMESDRMGHLLGAIDQAKLDEQRGVVQNEKRQGENQPYGKVFGTIFKNMFREGHPYAHLPIGSMEDLNAASLEDVREWFKIYYGAANTTLVIAGDVKPEAVKERVEHFFGHIPSGPPLTKSTEWINILKDDVRVSMQDRVPQARLYKLWKMPGIGSLESTQLDLTAGILSEGKDSRLYKRLVYNEQIAADVSAFALPLEISGVFGVIATVMPGQDMAAVEKSIDEEIAKFLKDGPTKSEIKRIVTTRRAGFIRGNERIGGFGGKSDTLASNQVYLGQPDFFKTTLKRWDEATPKALREVANEWMTHGHLALEVYPYQEGKVSENRVDRSKVPDAGAMPEVTFDVFEKATMENGLNIVLAKRDAVPIVNMQLVIDAGIAADFGENSGLASMTLDMIDEGTKKRDALEISSEIQSLGAAWQVFSTADTSNIRLSALKENLDDSMALFADILVNPAFPEKEFERLKKQRLANLAQAKVRPQSISRRVLDPLLYGNEHPYGGIETEKGLEDITINDIKQFHKNWFTPKNSTLVVVGDIDMATLKRQLNRSLKNWKTTSNVSKRFTNVKPAASTQIYLFDRPDSEQTFILASQLAPEKNTPQEFALQSMNEVLGGSFNARINMNLREDKHWSYGARSSISNVKAQRSFSVFAGVQTDKTSESMQEIMKELKAIQNAKPPSQDEVARAKDKQTLTLPGRWETYDAVLRDLVQMVRFDYADDYWKTYPERVKATSLQQVSQAAKDLLTEDRLTWVLVGDKAKIIDKVKALGYGDITEIDADGNLLGKL